MIAKIQKIINTNSREEYFENPTQDYFNPEKNQINLIYWKKRGSFIRHVPLHYWPQDSIWYALIRGYNCQAKCHYCYLQTYFKSSDLVKFNNIQDYIKFLEKFIKKFQKKYWTKQKLFLYDGDFYDSLWHALLKENISEINKIISLISKFDNVFFEIRTKATIQNANYEKLKISDKVIYAITFSPQDIIKKYEIWTWNFEQRLDFAKKISQRWWKVWIRIDPIIIDENIDFSLDNYVKMIKKIKNNFTWEEIHSWAIGVLRIKKMLYKKLSKSKSSIINNLIEENWFYTYPDDIRQNIYKKILKEIDSKNVYICMDTIH